MSADAQFVLGLDLDGVTGDYDDSFKKVVARECGVKVEDLPPPAHWDYAKSWPGVIEDLEHFLHLHQLAVNEGMFRTMEAMPGAHENLWKLSDAGVFIRVVTHRLIKPGTHRQVVADTIDFLDRQMPSGRKLVPYRDLCFVGRKSQIASDVFLDDAPHNIVSLREAGHYAITMDQSYNRDLPGPRARNWDEAHDLILARKAEVEAAQAAA